jgi:hypothetical protein
LTQYETYAQNEFELEPSQSMLMTGKGTGQDGAINPYYGENCYAIVENLGKSDFSIRIQQKGKIIETIPISSREVKKVKLLKGYELYFDSNSKEKVNAKLDFEKMDK